MSFILASNGIINLGTRDFLYVIVSIKVKDFFVLGSDIYKLLSPLNIKKCSGIFLLVIDVGFGHNPT